MSWAVNQGPSFNNILQPTQKLNGFFQRFELLQNDNRMTPGKRDKVPKKDDLRKGVKTSASSIAMPFRSISHARYTRVSPM